MTVLKNIAIFVAWALGAAVGVSFLLPAHWEVQREVRIQAEPRDVHRVLADLETWEVWSPWGLMVDARVTTNAGSSTLTWSGPEVGSGAVVVTAAEPAGGLWFDLDLRGDPVKGVFQYQRDDGGATDVRWTLRAEAGSNPLGRYRALFRRYTVGPEVVSALTRLKSRVERGAGAGGYARRTSGRA